jgi:tyrosine-protein kinase Etk/Wzc
MTNDREHGKRDLPVIREAMPLDQAAMARAMPMPWYEPVGQESNGLRDLTNRLLEHAGLVLITFAAVLALGVAFVVFSTPVYRVDALLQMEERAPNAPTSTQKAPGALEAPYLPVLGEMEILRSRELLVSAIAASRADVDIRVDNRFPLIGDWFARRFDKTAVGGVAPAPLGLDSFAWGGESLDLAKFDVPAHLYGEEFMIESRGDSWALYDMDRRFSFEGGFGKDTPLNFGANQAGVIRIDGIAGRPGTRFNVVRNDRAAIFADLQRELRILEPARQAGVVRLSIDTEDPQRSTALLNELMRGYLDRSVQVRTGDAERSLAFLNKQLPIVKSGLEKAEDELSAFRSRTQSVNLDQQSESAFAQVLQLERTRVELDLKQRELSERFGAQHPQMQMIRQQLATVNGRLGTLTNSFSALPRNQRDMVRLEREVNTQAALYTSMLNTMQELKVARAGMVGNARVVDPPRPSGRPVKPKPLIVMSIAAGIGVAASIAAALLAGMFRPTIREADEIETGTGLNTVVTVPESAKQRRLPRSGFFGSRTSPLLTLSSPDEPAVESLRSFRMRLTRDHAEPLSKAILITSATAGAGKTFVAANLAALLSSAGRRVLLIEADMRHPRLHTYFGTPRSPGLADLLAGNATFDQVVHRDVLPRVDLLMPGKPKENPGDLLSSGRLRELLDVIGDDYDHAVFDSVPILPAGDSLAIAQLPVSTFLVARAEHSTLSEIQEATRRLEGVKADIRGVVFNGAKRMRISHVRYYSYRPNNAA